MTAIAEPQCDRHATSAPEAAMLSTSVDLKISLVLVASGRVPCTASRSASSGVCGPALCHRPSDRRPASAARATAP